MSDWYFTNKDFTHLDVREADPTFDICQWMADAANARLQAEREKAPIIYGSLTGPGKELGWHKLFPNKNGPTHRARLEGIKEIKKHKCENPDCIGSKEV